MLKTAVGEISKLKLYVEKTEKVKTVSQRRKSSIFA